MSVRRVAAGSRGECYPAVAGRLGIGGPAERDDVAGRTCGSGECEGGVRRLRRGRRGRVGETGCPARVGGEGLGVRAEPQRIPLILRKPRRMAGAG